MFSAILGHSKSFIFVSSHPKSTWVTKTPYVGGLSIQYSIYCDSVVPSDYHHSVLLWYNSFLGMIITSKYLKSVYSIVYVQNKKSGWRRATELANFFIGTHLSYVEHYLPKDWAGRAGQARAVRQIGKKG